jgi:hypothetical protein
VEGRAEITLAQYVEVPNGIFKTPVVVIQLNILDLDPVYVDVLDPKDNEINFEQLENI